MNRIGRRILSLALAFTLAIGLPLQGNTVSAAGTDAAADVTPTKPTLPAGFSDPLEDDLEMVLATGASTATVQDFDTIIQVTTQWNKEGQCHAAVRDPKVFQSKAFTILLDVKQTAPTADTAQTDTRAAFSVGNETNYLRLLTYSGKFIYSSNRDNNSDSNSISLNGVAKDNWNAVAMTYEEKNGGNGHVVIYINGQKAGEVADIGFKLSAITDISAMIARTLGGTNYLQQGTYDNIVVGNSILDEQTAIAETAYRKYAKDNADLTPIEKTPVVLIKGSHVDEAAQNMNGLTYKGFGMLNGNSTSNLLLDYKDKAPEAYQAMMEYLFGGDYPLFTHIKMEMGNDGNNSTGAEACTMRYETEEADASRSPGFVMAADAKKINPDVKISILRWGMPKWVSDKWKTNTNNEGYEAMYKWYKETIFDAYEKYNYIIDFIDPDVNETKDPDEAFIKWFSNRIKNENEFPSYMKEDAQNAYHNIRIVASDEIDQVEIVSSMLKDSALYNSVDIVGYHYQTSDDSQKNCTNLADTDEKEIWYSEGCATFGYTELQENKTIEYGANSIGGYQSPLALMDSFITSFDCARMTHYIFQPAIGSFYEGLQYAHKELLSARDPWSGYIHYDPALYMLEHFSKFAKTGWEDSNPDTNDIWRAISTSTSAAFAGTADEHATAGIDGNAGYMTLAAPDKSDFSVIFVNNTQNEKTYNIQAKDMPVAAEKNLHLWVTETDNYLQDKGTVRKIGNVWTITLPAYSVVTATTLDTTPERTPKEDIHNEDRTVLDTDTTGSKLDTTDDVLYADNFEYEEELKKDADYLKNRGNEPRYMLDSHGAWVIENGKLKQELANSVSQWNSGDPSAIVGDFRWMDTVTSAEIKLPNTSSTTWAALTVRAQTGMNWSDSGYTARILGNGQWELYRIGTKVAEGTVTASSTNTYTMEITAVSDLISVAINGKTVTDYQDTVPIRSGRVKLSSSWSQVYFDDLLIKTVEGGIPYATTMVDGQDDCVTYNGTWTIDNPGRGDADNWYRTISTTSAANASFNFPIDGAGFAILGSNDGSAKLDVYVDNKLVAKDAATLASPTRGETYVLSDLEDKEHNIRVIVTSGKLQIDALYTLGARIALADNSQEVILGVKDSLPTIPAMLPTSSISSLPDKVTVITNSGEKVKSVIWNTSSDQFEGDEFVASAITGTIEDGVNILGEPYTISAPIEMIVPSGTVYYIDSVESHPDTATLKTTEPYETVKSLIGNQLLNEAYDRHYDDGDDWGLKNNYAGTKGYTSTTDPLATGIYGYGDNINVTLNYKLTLPAGAYKIISAHTEWWGNARSMKATISYGSQEINAGEILLNGTIGQTIINKKEFELNSQQTIEYVLTSFNQNQAPVISWLAVVDLGKDSSSESVHIHTYTNYTDNGNGTHTGTCGDDTETYTANHTFVDGKCIFCEAEDDHVHSYSYKDNGDGTHTATCKDGDDAYIEEHNIENGICTLCKATHTHTYTYTDNEDGLTHTVACALGDDTPHSENHTMQNGKCKYCGATHTHSYSENDYIDDENGLTHTAVCVLGDYTLSEMHTLDDSNTCTLCGGKHSHVYTYKANNDGATHTATCKLGDDTIANEAHTFVDGICTLCGFEHQHDFTYTQIDDATHKASCSVDGQEHDVTENHTFVDGICTLCEFEHQHDYTYTQIDGATHKVSCSVDGQEHDAIENHTFVNGICTKCDAIENSNEHTHTYTYKDNGDGTHTAICVDGDDTKTENHTYVNGICSACGAKESTTGSGANPGTGTDQTTNNGTNPTTGNGTNNTISVTSIIISNKKLTLGVKEPFTLTAKVSPANATNSKVTWKSSKPSVATVSATGKITAKKKGTAKITATADGKSATCTVTVKAAPKKITAKPKSKTIKKGKTFTIKPTLPKNTASNKITFTSSNKKVATVTAKGKVKGIKKGKATITVKTFNKKTAKVKVTVK